MKTYVITIETDNPDGGAVVREAAEKIACELDWGYLNSTNIEAMETNSALGAPRFVSAYYMEPGLSDEPTWEPDLFSLKDGSCVTFIAGDVTTGAFLVMNENGDQFNVDPDEWDWLETNS